MNNDINKVIRKQIRESDDLVSTLKKIADQYFILGYGFGTWMPYTDIIVDENDITCYFYQNGSKTFHDVNKFSYSLRFRKIDGYARKTQICDFRDSSEENNELQDNEHRYMV